MRASLVALAVGVGLLSARADASRPPRTSVTVEIGVGVGAHRHDHRDRSETAAALTGGGSVGAFVTPNVALMYHVASAIALRDTAVTTALHSGVLQWWPSESFFVSGGPGIALHSPAGMLPATDNPYGETRVGFGASLRAGWAFSNEGHSSWHLSAEAVPTFFGSTGVAFAALQSEWQYL